MIQDVFQEMVGALSKSARPEAVMQHIAQAYQDEIGYRLLTVTTIDRTRAKPVYRLWSSSPEVYPIGGEKEIGTEDWMRRVMVARQTVVCNTAEELRDTFPTDAPLDGMGMGSGVNLPIVLDNEVLGTVNLFHETRWFTAERVAKAQALVALVYTPILLARQQRAAGSTTTMERQQ